MEIGNWDAETWIFPLISSFQFLISLILDDGVKANYGKFGNLLAETKAIAGEK